MCRANMYRSVRIFIFLLLVSLWTAGLFITSYPAKAQSEQPQQPVQSEGSFLGHIVQPGEDLDSIAAHYGTTAAAIVEENHLSATVQLTPGRLLHIRSWDEQPQVPS